MIRTFANDKEHFGKIFLVDLDADYNKYFETGKRQLLISPGALDMAGLMITARTVDFDKIRKEDIEDIYSQVSMSII